MTQSDRPALPCAHLGELLHRFREQFAWQLTGCTAPPPTHSCASQLEMSLERVVAALEADGYSMRAAAYREAEAGKLPGDVGRFVDAFVKCLKLEEDSHQVLRVQAAFDLLRAEMGEELARLALAEAVNNS